MPKNIQILPSLQNLAKSGHTELNLIKWTERPINVLSITLIMLCLSFLPFVYIALIFFKQMGLASFSFILNFSHKHYNFYNKYTWKMFIQYTVLGLEPITFRPESLPIATRPWLPPKVWSFALLDLLVIF